MTYSMIWEGSRDVRWGGIQPTGDSRLVGDIQTWRGCTLQIPVETPEIIIATYVKEISTFKSQPSKWKQGKKCGKKARKTSKKISLDVQSIVDQTFAMNLRQGNTDNWRWIVDGKKHAKKFFWQFFMIFVFRNSASPFRDILKSVHGHVGNLSNNRRFVIFTTFFRPKNFRLLSMSFKSFSWSTSCVICLGR